MTSFISQTRVSSSERKPCSVIVSLRLRGPRLSLLEDIAGGSSEGYSTSAGIARITQSESNTEADLLEIAAAVRSQRSAAVWTTGSPVDENMLLFALDRFADVEARSINRSAHVSTALRLWRSVIAVVGLVSHETVSWRFAQNGP